MSFRRRSEEVFWPLADKYPSVYVPDEVIYIQGLIPFELVAEPKIIWFELLYPSPKAY